MDAAAVAQHVQAVADNGYTIVEQAIEPELLDALHRDLRDLERFFEVEPAANSFEGHHTLRLYNLLAFGRIFEQVPVHANVLPIVESVLDPGCLISSLSSISIEPGETAQPIHADDQLIPIPKPHPPTVCNSMWALTDFTEANGATRLVPGTHLADHSPDYGAHYDSIAAEMPAGSVLIWHGSLWHGGGANTTDETRMGIAMNYCAGYIRQQENQQLGLSRETVERFSPRLRELVGYSVYNMLIGHINKQSPAQLLLDREPFATAQPHGVGSHLTRAPRRRQRRCAAADAQPSRGPERVRHAALRRVRAGASREASARDDIACVVLTGTGRAFSAGQDLGEMSRIDPTGTAPSDPADAGPGFPRFIDTVAAFEKPLIAAVNGLGVGIGLTVLLHCDLVLIARGARLRAPFVPLGVVPEAAGSLLMPAVMGGQRAALALVHRASGSRAEDAVACGLALRMVEPDALLTDTMELAGRIARMPVSSLVETKRLVLAGRIDAIRAARAREDQAFARMVGAPANLEALTAFLEKREPNFRGIVAST